MSTSPLSTGDPRLERAHAMSATLARNWWAVLLRGIFAVVFGLIALVLPGVTIATLVILFAAYMLVDGVFAIVSGVKAAQRHERWGFLILEGIADLLAAAVAMVWPAITVLVFVTLIAVWALVSGLFMIVAAFRLHLDHGRWLLVLGGAVSVLFGVMLLVAPGAAALVLTWWLGGYALVFGIMMIVLSMRLRGRHATTLTRAGIGPSGPVRP